MVSYSAEFIKRLEIQWGVGFLSPGGAQEVLEILKDVDLSGKNVLDIGCGVGGPAIVMANNFDVQSIIGTDIEPQIIDQARANVRQAGLLNRIEPRLVEIGPLPFEDGVFDVVFSKDSLIHIKDKGGFYREILRVLKPGGLFAASDWLAGEDAEDHKDYHTWQALSPLTFNLETAKQSAEVMRNAGFRNIKLRDRNAWYVQESWREVDMIKSAWRDQYLEYKDEAYYQHALEARIANAGAAACGALRPTHLFGTKKG